METTPKKRSLATWFIDFITLRPWAALGIALALTAGFVPLGLSRVFNDTSYRIWFQEGDSFLKQYDAFQARFGNDSAVVLVVHSPSGIFDPDSAKLMIDLTNEMGELPDVFRVDSLVTYNWVHGDGDDIVIEPIIPDDAELTPAFLAERKAIALKDEQLPGYLVSRDGKTSLIYGWLKPVDKVSSKNDNAAISKGVDDIIAKHKGQGDHEFHATGSPIIEFKFKDINDHDSARLMPVLFGVAMLVLFLFLRRFSAVFISMVTVMLTVTAGIAGAGWLGMGLNNLTLLVPVVLVAVTLAYAVNLLSAFFSALRSGRSRIDSVKHALDKYLMPMFYANVSTALGYVSFLTARVIPLMQLGVLAAIGCIWAWLFAHFVLMPLCVLLPLRASKATKADAAEGEMEVPSPWVSRFATWVDRNRRRIIVGFAVVMIGSVAIGIRNQVDYDSFTMFAKDSEVNRAHDFLESHVGWLRSAEVLVNTGKEDGAKDPEFLNKLDALQQFIATRPFVSRTYSIVDILKATNRALHANAEEWFKLPVTHDAIAEQFLLYTMNLHAGQDLNDRMTLHGDAVRITVWWTLRDSQRTFRAIGEIERKAAELGLNIEVTGRGILYQRMSTYFVDTFLVALAISILLITLTLWACFRSLSLAILTLYPNLVALAVGFMVFYLGGRSIDIAAILVYSIALGFAVDNTIYIAVRFKKLSATELEPDVMLGQVYAAYGPAMIIGVLVLAVSLSVLLLSSFIPLVWFGLMTTTIMVAALISDILLTPALMLVIVRRWRRRRQGRQPGS